MTPFFELVDTFVITGRGTVVTGHVTGLVRAGDHMRSGDQRTEIRGVERHLVHGADTETRRRKVGLLVEGAPSDYHRQLGRGVGLLHRERSLVHDPTLLVTGQHGTDVLVLAVLLLESVEFEVLHQASR